MDAFFFITATIGVLSLIFGLYQFTYSRKKRAQWIIALVVCFVFFLLAYQHVLNGFTTDYQHLWP